MKFLLTLILLPSIYGQTFQLAQSDDCGQIDEVPNDIRSRVPWTAGIFGRASANKQFEFYISGTIIGPTTILTVLGGVYGQPPTEGKKYTIPAPHNHIIAAGLKTTNLQLKDRFTQVVEVSHIIPYSGNETGNSQYHFFLFHLKQPLQFNTPYVRSACIPAFLKHIPQSDYGRNVEVRQGGYTTMGEPQGGDEGNSKMLRVVQTSLEPAKYCDGKYKSYYSTDSTDHIYCGKPLEQRSQSGGFPCVSYGSAAVVPVHSRWYVAGVIALHPTAPNEKSWCNKNMIYFYGKIIPAMDWILDNLKCPPSTFACGDNKCISLDKVCDQKADCDLSKDEDAIYCRARKPCIAHKSFECGIYGPCLKQTSVCDGVRDCPDGEDEDVSICGNSLPLSVLTPESHPNDDTDHRPKSQGQAQSKTTELPTIGNRDGLRCPPLQKSEGVEIKCADSSTNEKVSCDRASAGTVAKFECQRHYVSNYRLPTTEMTCREDGSWKPFRSFGCDAQCGILENPLVQSYVVNGQTATTRERFPWHTAIFAKKNNEFSFICGGSLIEKAVLVTAAHCITDGAGQLVRNNNFKIVLGGNSSTFSTNEKNRDAQIFGIKNMWIPATYDRRTLQSDIALIQLDKDAVYGEFVRPVCYLQKGSNSVPAPGTLGKVPGYGYTSEQKISEYLQFAEFPVISPQGCVESLKKTPPLLTFCAGYKNGTSVCQGDSGGGMVFPEMAGPIKKYVLKGVVSHGEVKVGRLCDPNNYAVFTHVPSFADWLLQKLDDLL